MECAQDIVFDKSFFNTEEGIQAEPDKFEAWKTTKEMIYCNQIQINAFGANKNFRYYIPGPCRLRAK